MTTQVKKIGVVSHWYSHLGVAAVELTDGDLHLGDRIYVHGHTTDLEQPVGSIQIDHHPVEEGHVGDSVGIKLGDHAREHDIVYLVVGEDTP